jgi:hypothetical protein
VNKLYSTKDFGSKGRVTSAKPYRSTTMDIGALMGTEEERLQDSAELIEEESNTYCVDATQEDD